MQKQRSKAKDRVTHTPFSFQSFCIHQVQSVGETCAYEGVKSTQLVSFVLILTVLVKTKQIHMYELQVMNYVSWGIPDPS